MCMHCAYFVLLISKLQLTMKKFFTTLFVLMLCASSAFAQHESEIAAIQEHFKDNSKKNIIRKFMKLEGEKATKFWAIYDEYEEARKQLVERRQANTIAYVKGFDNMTDELAEELIDEARSIRSSEVALKTKYVRKMERELGGIIALQFLEIDKYIEYVVGKEFSETLPFIGEDW
jgi:hypothetical protein